MPTIPSRCRCRIPLTRTQRECFETIDLLYACFPPSSLFATSPIVSLFVNMTVPTIAELEQAVCTMSCVLTLHKQLGLLHPPLPFPDKYHRHYPPVLMPMLSGGAQQQQQVCKDPAPQQTTTTTSLLERFYRIPQPVRYFVAGNLGNIVFFSLERLLYLGMLQLVQNDSTANNNNNINKLLESIAVWADTITFFSAYMLHIPAQHYLYALLVFGLDSINTPSKYWKTLGGTYSALMAASIGSTVLNTTLLKWGLPRTTAFVATLWTFACFNYFVIRWIVNRTSHDTNNKEMQQQQKQLPNEKKKDN